MDWFPFDFNSTLFQHIDLVYGILKFFLCQFALSTESIIYQRTQCATRLGGFLQCNQAFMMRID
jgi:hypothetical protein